MGGRSVANGSGVAAGDEAVRVTRSVPVSDAGCSAGDGRSAEGVGVVVVGARDAAGARATVGPRVEAGVSEGVRVRVAVASGARATVGPRVEAGVSEGVRVRVAVASGARATVGPRVEAGVSEGVRVRVAVAAGAGAAAGVAGGVRVRAAGAARAAVAAGVAAAVRDCEAVGVREGVGVGDAAGASGAGPAVGAAGPVGVGAAAGVCEGVGVGGAVGVQETVALGEAGPRCVAVGTSGAESGRDGDGDTDDGAGPGAGPGAGDPPGPGGAAAAAGQRPAASQPAPGHVHSSQKRPAQCPRQLQPPPTHSPRHRGHALLLPPQMPQLSRRRPLPTTPSQPGPRAAAASSSGGSAPWHSGALHKSATRCGRSAGAGLPFRKNHRGGGSHVQGDALCFVVKTWARQKTTETVLNNGWRLAVGCG